MAVLRTLPSSSRTFSKAFLCSLDLKKVVRLTGSLASHFHFPPPSSPPPHPHLHHPASAFSPELASEQGGERRGLLLPQHILTCVPGLDVP